MTVYIVVAGESTGTDVSYANVVAFTTRWEAQTVVTAATQTVVTAAKREEPYLHQYDKVEALPVYRTRKQWFNGIKQRAKVRVRKRAAR